MSRKVIENSNGLAHPSHPGIQLRAVAAAAALLAMHTAVAQETATAKPAAPADKAIEKTWP